MPLISLSLLELLHLLVLVITSPWLFLSLPWLLLLTTVLKWLCPHGPAPLLSSPHKLFLSALFNNHSLPSITQLPPTKAK